MEDILKIVRSLEDSGLLLKGVSETIQNEAKKQKGRFLSMLLGTLSEYCLIKKVKERLELVKEQLEQAADLRDLG